MPQSFNNAKRGGRLRQVVIKISVGYNALGYHARKPRYAALSSPMDVLHAPANENYQAR